MPDAPTSPPWFSDALSHRPRHHTVDIDGCEIHYRSWGDPNHPPLMLVHGGAAHSGWWDHIAPLLARQHHVLAIDLSGHGDSGHRQSYTLGGWAKEVLTVATSGKSDARPTIVGHSLGGWIAASVAMRFGDALNGIVVVDSPLHDSAPERRELRSRGNPGGYRTRKEIVARFRAVPEQDTTLAYVAAHIGAESVRKRDGRWFWKFDPAISARTQSIDVPAEHEELEYVFSSMFCRIAYFRCSDGLVSDAMSDQIRGLLQLRGPFVEIAHAGHHPMLDQPQALVACLRTLVEMWSIT
ncbi:alpha/beta fold hydrolase [Mycolicibacterium fluoranthenivorans]|nr:alpha/beta hydrolase [Mycolicibacterium fluoranthenivorans]